ncbi:MAG: methionyl-tRNA formyltransferase [Candidatus Obscuribacterales bacterium]|nr:methionyl-tRNA formyltransferase [Candidatus Obscuribacterales bacterium]
MRIIFLGTPEFAVPSLQKLIAYEDCTIVGLVTQPDRPAGRGKQLLVPPTKILALKHDIPVFQPERLSKEKNIVAAMQELKPDLLVTVAFGQILKNDVLTMAPHGVINVHGSLLPKYRGAAPINWALLKGETVTGITTMYSDPGIDTGAMLLKHECAIAPDTTALELAESLSHLGAQVLIETIQKLQEGSLQAIAQDDAQATYAPRLNKEMGLIKWELPATEIHNLVRGLFPWPGTYTRFNGQTLKVLTTASSQELLTNSETPGTVLKKGNQLFVVCGNGQELLEVIQVKPENKGQMSALAWLNGLHSESSIILGDQ